MRTENALRALLTRTVSTTRIKTCHAWVGLNGTGNADAAAGGGIWRLAVADALKVELSEVDEMFVQLRAEGLVGSDSLLTILGAAELATARQALDHIRRRAEALLRV